MKARAASNHRGGEPPLIWRASNEIYFSRSVNLECIIRPNSRMQRLRSPRILESVEKCVRRVYLNPEGAAAARSVKSVYVSRSVSLRCRQTKLFSFIYIFPRTLVRSCRLLNEFLVIETACQRTWHSLRETVGEGWGVIKNAAGGRTPCASTMWN